MFAVSSLLHDPEGSIDLFRYSLKDLIWNFIL
jgi:hypothetical protein